MPDWLPREGWDHYLGLGSSSAAPQAVPGAPEATQMRVTPGEKLISLRNQEGDGCLDIYQ